MDTRKEKPLLRHRCSCVHSWWRAGADKVPEDFLGCSELSALIWQALRGNSGSGQGDAGFQVSSWVSPALASYGLAGFSVLGTLRVV